MILNLLAHAEARRLLLRGGLDAAQDAVSGALPGALGGPGIIPPTTNVPMLMAMVEEMKAETDGKPIDAVMDLVGGEMTDVFIDTMIFDMNARSTYPRLSIAGASGGNISEILWTRIYLYQVQIFGVSHGTREEAEQLLASPKGVAR